MVCGVKRGETCFEDIELGPMLCVDSEVYKCSGVVESSGLNIKKLLFY